MTAEREVALGLLKRLLAGEEGDLPMCLSLLLEKSSALHDTDDHYRQILPKELAEVRFSANTVNEVITSLCAELSRNPRWSIIAALSTTGADEVTKAISALLLNPPRPLEMKEYAQALGIENTFLPICLKDDPNFLPKHNLDRLADLLREFQDLADHETDRAERIMIRRDAGQLLKKLSQ
jgi:hypothetical protein